jgi:hypothetical protein
MGRQACYVLMIIPPAEHIVVVLLFVRRKEILGSCTCSIILILEQWKSQNVKIRGSINIRAI